MREPTRTIAGAGRRATRAGHRRYRRPNFTERASGSARPWTDHPEPARLPAAAASAIDGSGARQAAGTSGIAEPAAKRRDEVERPPPHGFTIDDDEKMAKAEILGEDDRVELAEGGIVDVPSNSSQHVGTIERSLGRVHELPPARRYVPSVRDPVRSNLYSEPQPDPAVLRWREDGNARSHPGATDVPLLIEVMQSGPTTTAG